MARLIPSFLDADAPPGERDVFNRFTDAPVDWVVLHSLDLAPWNRQRRTEIDFVVIVPDTGIICIEVKSQSRITFENDRWMPPDIKRSPIKQALDARFAFRRRLVDLAPYAKQIPVVHCCIFPRSWFDIEPGMSIQPAELMDARDFSALSTSRQFCDDLRKRMHAMIASDASVPFLPSPLPPQRVDDIVGFCAPIQRRRVLAREEMAQHDLEAERLLRSQQKPILQLALLNSRLVVSGAAGTGKTLIAIEVARRAAERGRRVALVCFNQLVGEWIRRRVEAAGPPPPTLVTGRAVKLMAEICGIAIPANPTPTFWTEELFDGLEDCLTNPELLEVGSFDYLVVDEAQDILARPRLWDCLTALLNGGATRGSFALFGDFEHQVLGERTDMIRQLEMLQNPTPCTHWRLTENCRNYRIIAATAVCMSGFSDEVYTDYLRPEGSPADLRILTFVDESEQVKLLAEQIRELRARGYRDVEITVLSFIQPSESAAARLAKTGFALRPAWNAGNHISYASVHAFKGMENKVVILTDLVLGAAEFHRHLFYTAMTRATGPVRILCRADSALTIVEWAAEARYA